MANTGARQQPRRRVASRTSRPDSGSGCDCRPPTRWTPDQEPTSSTLNILLSYYDLVPLTSGTTGRRKLTKAARVSAPSNVPPIDEQAEIVTRVSHLLRVADGPRSRLDAAERYIDRSSQAVLAQAFRGELGEHEGKP